MSSLLYCTKNPTPPLDNLPALKGARLSSKNQIKEVKNKAGGILTDEQDSAGSAKGKR